MEQYRLSLRHKEEMVFFLAWYHCDNNCNARHEVEKNCGKNSTPIFSLYKRPW
jgi:hypothetical protein